MFIERPVKSGVRICATAMLLLLGAASAAAAGAMDLNRQVEFNIPPQKLSTALLQFAQQAKIQLVLGEDLGDRTTGEVSGVLKIGDALSSLLGASGLSYKIVSDTAITVAYPGPSSPHAPASSMVERETDWTLAMSVAQTEETPVRATAGAQEQDPEQTAAEAAGADQREIVVTGSHIKRSSAEAQGPAPVTILTREQMEREGFTTAYEALYTLTQQTGAGLQTQFQPNGATANATNVDLRGLGPGRVLILFNGRRAADYPLPFNGQSNIVNLSAIPTAALDRIEVLASGASAIYGSDAVSGVINFVMRDHFDGTAINARIGGTTEGGGSTRRLQLTGGLDHGAFNAVYALEYFERDPIWALDRSAFDSNDDAPPGFPVADDFVAGLIALFPAVSLIDPTAVACSRFGRDVRLSPLGGLGNICSSRDLQAQRTIRHETEDKSGFFNGRYDFGNNLQLFGTASVWQSDSRFHTQLGPNTLFESPLLLDVTPGVPQDLGGMAGGQYLQVLRFFQINEMPDPDLMFDERAWDAVLGLRGTAFGGRFDWEVAYHHSSYDVVRDQRTPLTQEIFDFYFGPLLGTDPLLGVPMYQVRRDRVLRALTPDEFRSITSLNHTEADSSNDQVNAVFTGEAFNLPAGPVQFAGVLEWGTQDYQINLDPRLTAGEFYGLTEYPGQGERDRYAVGMELALPVLENVRLTLASRYDGYDDITAVDDAVTYNAGLEYRPITNLLLRGTYATSFRAPDMHFVFAAPSSNFATPSDFLRCRRDFGLTSTTLNQCVGLIPPVIIPSHRQGNPGLKEETGRSWTAGVAWSFLDGIDISIDYFDIRLDNIVNDVSFDFILRTEADCRIGSTLAGETVNPNSALCQFAYSQVSRNPLVGPLMPNVPGSDSLIEVSTGPINRALQNVRGLDSALNYRLNTAQFGTFRVNLSWSHVLEQERQEFAVDPVDSYRDDPENQDLRSRMRGSVGWSKGGWTHTLFGDYRGSRPTFDNLSRTRTYITYNFSTSYQPTENLRFGLVVDNLFDEDPKIDPTFSSYPFFRQSNVNPVGREVFFDIGYSFR